MQSVSATIEQKVPNLLRGKLILVIDDEASVRLGCKACSKAGAAGASLPWTQHEALHRPERRASPDFIIADLRLRGEDTGIDAIRVLRAHSASRFPRS